MLLFIITIKMPFLSSLLISLHYKCNGPSWATALGTRKRVYLRI
jgi:hypothetical protein